MRGLQTKGTIKLPFIFTYVVTYTYTHGLFFFTWLSVTVYYLFVSAEGLILFGNSFRAGLVIMNSLNFYLGIP